MLRRYELTYEEWNRIAPLLPPENSRKQGRPQKCNRTILNGIVWIARNGTPWRDLPERYGSWQTVYSRFRKWIEDGTLYLKAKQIKENLENSKKKLSTENDYSEAINEIEQNIEDIKNHLVDDNRVVKKGTDGITVKLFPQ